MGQNDLVEILEFLKRIVPRGLDEEERLVRIVKKIQTKVHKSWWIYHDTPND